MDLVTAVVLCAITATLIPTIGPAIISGGKTLVAYGINGVSKFKKNRRKKNKKYQEKLERQRSLYQVLNKQRTQKFTNIKNERTRQYNILEMNTFDEKVDKVYRGTLYVKMPDRQESQDEIYLFLGSL